MTNSIIKYIICIGFFINISAYSQNTPSNSDLKTIQVKEFISNNLDSIKHYNPLLKTITIEIIVNDKTSLCNEIFFYDKFDTNSRKIIQPWSKLELFVKNLFYFNPSFENEESPEFSMLKFEVLIDKKKNDKDIKARKKEFKNNNNNLIIPNSKYRLKIHEFKNSPIINDTTSYSVKDFVIDSKLEGLNSEIFKIHNNYYLFFKVVNSSNNGQCYSNILITIYYLRNSITYSLGTYDINGMYTRGIYRHESSSGMKNEKDEYIELDKFKCEIEFRE